MTGLESRPDLELEPSRDMATIVAVLGAFGESSYRTGEELSGYLEENPDPYIEFLEKMNYVRVIDQGYKLAEDDAIRKDAELINRFIEENYRGYAPAFIDSFEAEIPGLDAITTSLDLGLLECQ